MVVTSATNDTIRQLVTLEDELFPENSMGWPRVARHIQHGDITVVEENGRVLGYCIHALKLLEPDEIVRLGVDPAARRRGIAWLLLTTAMRMSSASGTPKPIELSCRDDNEPALQLYRRAGFVPVGEEQTDWGTRQIRMRATSPST